ncbi:MAG: NAD-dependent epimerase/dehydratase family protein [Nitrospirae bacterium]|nr:NAD-dependent epimerase/dehydratase family protein [Nitrospirota bacterium]
MREKMKALGTGGCGFIGTSLVDALAAGGHSVSVLDVAAIEGLVDKRGVRYFRGDMGSRDVLASAVAGMDVVYHLAWSTIPQTSNEDPGFDVNSNLGGTLKLLDACLEAGVRGVVFLSSGGTVYGIPAGVPIREDAPLEPINSYGITKLAVEKYLALYHRLHGLEYTVLRPSNPYGPNQNPLGKVGTVAVFMHRVMSGLPVRIWGDGSVVRDYVYISDLVDALLKAGSPHPGAGRVFNIGSGAGLSLLDLLGKVAKVAGREPEVVFEPCRVFDVPVNILDNTRAADGLGWSPATPVDDGLEKTYSWMKAWLAGAAARGPV